MAGEETALRHTLAVSESGVGVFLRTELLQQPPVSASGFFLFSAVSYT